MTRNPRLWIPLLLLVGVAAAVFFAKRLSPGPEPDSPLPASVAARGILEGAGEGDALLNGEVLRRAPPEPPAPADGERAGIGSRQVLTFATRAGVPDLACASAPARAQRPGPPSGGLAALPPWLQGLATRQARIAIWGDSHMAGDAFVGEIARAIEARGARVAQSLVPLGIAHHGAPHALRAACIPVDEWEAVPAFRASQTLPVGPSLLVLRSVAAGSSLALDLREREGGPVHDRLAVRYTPSETDLTLAVTVDHGEEQVVHLPGSAPPGRLAELLIRSRGPMSIVTLKVIDGTLALQALLLSPRGAGVASLDVFALRSSTAKGWALADAATLRAALEGVHYDAVILAYGTNEAAAPHYAREAYEGDLRASLAALRRVFPAQPCVLVGPPDRGLAGAAGGGSWAERHREVSRVQAEAAVKFDCAFWDWQSAMGGPGSSHRWADSQPPLMNRDLTHLTWNGYQRSGVAFAGALGLGHAP